MSQEQICQRPDCDEPGRPRLITSPAGGKQVTLYLCDADYQAASMKNAPPGWLTELLTHLGLVG